jgi:hypothetical protein
LEIQIFRSLATQVHLSKVVSGMERKRSLIGLFCLEMDFVKLLIGFLIFNFVATISIFAVYSMSEDEQTTFLADVSIS